MMFNESIIPNILTLHKAITHLRDHVPHLLSNEVTPENITETINDYNATIFVLQSMQRLIDNSLNKLYQTMNKYIDVYGTGNRLSNKEISELYKEIIRKYGDHIHRLILEHNPYTDLYSLHIILDDYEYRIDIPYEIAIAFYHYLITYDLTKDPRSIQLFFKRHFIHYIKHNDIKNDLPPY